MKIQLAQKYGKCSNCKKLQIDESKELRFYDILLGEETNQFTMIGLCSNCMFEFQNKLKKVIDGRWYKKY